MSAVRENLLTAGLLIPCVLLVLFNLNPRLFPTDAVFERQQSDVVVSVSGAVARPGVYELPWGARAADLIQAAGGLTGEAEATLVNLALPLDTGSTIMVPTRYAPSGDERISLNTSSQRDLESLPGIGPVIAGRIIENRPYDSVDELTRVSGIGLATLERLQPLVKP